MKRFKDFAKEIPVLSWGGHETIRDKIRKVKEKIPTLSWGGHETVNHEFRSKIDQKHHEKAHKVRAEAAIDESLASPMGYLSGYDEAFHNHPDIKPQLTDEHIKAIRGYTDTASKHEEGWRGSRNINGLLRRDRGATDKHAGIMHHSEEAVRRGVTGIMSIFTKTNTNRAERKMYGGIPSHIGKSLKGMNHGDTFHLPGVTSATSDADVAKSFAHSYEKPNAREHHVIRYQAAPDTFVSTAGVSRYKEENEGIFRPGAKCTYHGTIKHEYIHPATKKKHVVHEHIVSVSNEHLPIGPNGKYTDLD